MMITNKSSRLYKITIIIKRNYCHLIDHFFPIAIQCIIIINIGDIDKAIVTSVINNHIYNNNHGGKMSKTWEPKQP